MTVETNPAPVPVGTLDAPYLLALDSAVIQGPDGRFWTDPLWARDLEGHARVFPNMTMFGAILHIPVPDDAKPLDVGAMRFVASRHSYGRRAFLTGLPRFLMTLTREIRRAEVVHTTVSSDFIPYGWFAIPIARLMGKKTVVTIEASFWRLRPGEQASTGRRFRAWAVEAINRWCMRQVDYATYQHEQYRQSLPSPRAGGGVISQASWISAAAVIDEGEMAVRATRRREPGRRTRFLFATRLIPAKGTRQVIAAIERLAGLGIDCDVHVIGTGEDRALFEPLHGRAIGGGEMRLLDPVPYDQRFLRLIDDYDVLLSPSLSDEQPRIIYDAGSRGVGAVISATPGLRSCVVEGESAVVVPVGDVDALVETMIGLTRSPDLIDRLANGARRHALANTHERMHEERRDGIAAMLARTGAWPKGT